MGVLEVSSTGDKQIGTNKEERKKTHKLKHGANAAAEVEVDQIL